MFFRGELAQKRPRGSRAGKQARPMTIDHPAYRQRPAELLSPHVARMRCDVLGTVFSNRPGEWYRRRGGAYPRINQKRGVRCVKSDLQAASDAVWFCFRAALSVAAALICAAYSSCRLLRKRSPLHPRQRSGPCPPAPGRRTAHLDKINPNKVFSEQYCLHCR